MEQRRAEGVLESEGEREEFDVFGVSWEGGAGRSVEKSDKQIFLIMSHIWAEFFLMV